MGCSGDYLDCDLEEGGKDGEHSGKRERVWGEVEVKDLHVEKCVQSRRLIVCNRYVLHIPRSGSKKKCD